MPRESKMFQKVSKYVNGGQLAVILYGASAASAFAQTTTYDVSTVTTAIAATVAAILSIGAAVVAGPKIAIKVWKWIGSAL